MATCPNKNLTAWQKLVQVHGDTRALYLWDKYNGDVPSIYLKSLDQVLTDGFLKDFGITVTDYDNLKKDLNVDGVTASDFLSKSIVRNKGESITPEVAYFAYAMLGKENDKIRSTLRYLISKWDKYDQQWKYHTDSLKRKNIYVEDTKEYVQKIRDLVIIDFLKDQLEFYYNNPTEFAKQLDKKWTKEDFTLWQQFINWLEKTLEAFSSKILTDKKKRELLENVGLSIVDEVLNRNYEYFNYDIGQDAIRKYYKQTIESDPFAKQIVEYGQSIKMVLTGSLAVRRAGVLYRPVTETIHDIDWVVPYYLVSEGNNIEITNKILNNIQSPYQNEYIDKLKIDNESKNTLLHIMQYDWFNQFIEKFPNFQFIGGFYGKEHLINKESFTAQGVINGQFYETDGVHEETYTYYQKDPITKRPFKVTRTEKRKHKKGDYIKETGYVIDFFVRLTPMQEEHENYFKLWKEIFIAKLKMGRAKDFADWKIFIPYLKSNDKYNFYYEGFRHINEQSNPNYALEDISKTMVKAYQGTQGGRIDNRLYNYYTTDKNEASDYGIIREIDIDTEYFIKANTPEYKNINMDFLKKENYMFDILDNSTSGLAKQKKFFDYLSNLGYNGIDMSMFSDTKYLIEFRNNRDVGNVQYPNLTDDRYAEISDLLTNDWQNIDNDSENPLEC